MTDMQFKDIMESLRGAVVKDPSKPYLYWYNVLQQLEELKKENEKLKWQLSHQD